MSVEKWLSGLDPGLVVYAEHLKELGFSSDKMIKFLKLKDLQKMACAIPAPHRRMILDAVSKLQTPDSKNKGDIETPDSEDDGIKRRRKESVSSNNLTSKNLSPRKLFDTTVSKEQSNMSDTVEKVLMTEKVNLESDLARLKKEFIEFTTPPVELMPLILPGCRMMASTCARCHHRGHRKDGNKNGVCCQFEPCLGFHYCGLEKLHAEFKAEKREKDKSIKNVEAKIREKEQELSQLQEFAIKSQTNFVRNVRPRLLRLFPELYKGKDGNQRLLRDTRYLKISCNGKIPEPTSNERDHLQQLIRAGKSKVVQDLGMDEDADNFLIDEENELARLDRHSDSDLDQDEEKVPAVIKPPATTVPHESSSEKEHHTNASIARHTTMHDMPQSTGLMYLPTPTFSAQPHGNFYFNVENPGFVHPYHHLQYPQYRYNSLAQYQSAFTSTNPYDQSNSAFTITNPQAQYQSAFTNSTPHVQSNSTITNTNSQTQPSSTSEASTTLLNLADVALQQK